MCNCSSSNRPEFGTEPQVQLDPNEYFKWDSLSRLVCVDVCIAEQIKALWRAGIWTGGCCCGHNGQFGDKYGGGPIVAIVKGENPEKAKNILKECDPGREWAVLQWKLINTSAG